MPPPESESTPPTPQMLADAVSGIRLLLAILFLFTLALFAITIYTMDQATKANNRASDAYTLAQSIERSLA
jgi:hypothetical protein